MNVNWKKFYFKTVSVLFFLTIFFFSCKNKSNNDKPLAVESDTIRVGRVLYIPDRLETYRPFSNYLLDSNKIAKAPLKIYCFVNVSCSTCIDDIKKWDSSIPRFMDFAVPVILICQSKDNFELIKYFCEQGDVKKFAFPFFLDTKNEFLDKNSFIDESTRFHVILTDSLNKILLFGDPTKSKKVMEQYLNVMKKL
jgi:hypothetical protein